ncbi:MOSC domain-containing protein [Serinicoccus chungangensis]|uniref:MOSC domain-containing protein n=1 Tax=Serinicoccus chungangensis TaxID=767452 RepID=UPI00111AE69D|nr:MOSC domain-containing protein [Serinicoccus chungangensis]
MTGRARVRSTNLARPRPDPGTPRTTGIDKHPVDGIDVVAPGPRHGDGSGAVGDHVGDARHHGGADKAVYAVAREELDWWEGELGRVLRDGIFGENLTTSGIDLDGLELGRHLHVGSATLQVSLPRQPCATFARHLGEQRWGRRFTERGACGAYLRVLVPGRISPGDPVGLGAPPGHGVSVRTAFAAAMGDLGAAREVVAADVLPGRYHDALARRVRAGASR